MLNDTVLSFLQACDQDKALQIQLGESDMDNLLSTARAIGYYFTEEEFKATVSAIVFNVMSDEDLDMIAAGVAGGSVMPTPSTDNPIFTNPAFLIQGL